MENLFSFGSEQTSPEETLTYMVGQSVSPATPSHNLIYHETGLSLYLTDLGDGDLSFHADIQGEIPLSRFKHLKIIFQKVLLGLLERGVPELCTYVETETQANFALYFGFEPTGKTRKIWYEDGREGFYHHMIFDLREFY